MFYLLFISFLSLFYFFFISFYFFLSLFYFFFISFLFLSARRIFVHNYFLFLLYGDAPLVLEVTTSTQAPIISHFFFIKSSTIFNGPFAERWNVNRHLKICLIKVYYYLAGRFDSILFNWAIINFFPIEYYVWAYWISYVEFVFQNKITLSQFCGNYDVCPHFNNVDSLNPAADRWALHPCLASRAIKISPRYV